MVTFAKLDQRHLVKVGSKLGRCGANCDAIPGDYIIVRVFVAHHMSSMIVSEVSVSVVSVFGGKGMCVYTGDGDSNRCSCVGTIVCSAVLQLMSGQQVAHSIEKTVSVLSVSRRGSSGCFSNCAVQDRLLLRVERLKVLRRNFQ